jgi:hypothetical protein
MLTSILSPFWRPFRELTRRHKAAYPLFLVFAVVSMPTATGSVYKCVSSDGSLTYSDSPCASNAQRINLQATVTRVSSDIVAPLIQRAIYASPRNGRALDVTTQLRSQCPAGSASCMIDCGNQLAGDPDFGQRKYCRIEYQCGDGKPQELQILEGTHAALSCTSAIASQVVHHVQGHDPTGGWQSKGRDVSAAVTNRVVALRDIVIALNGGADVGPALDVAAVLQMRVIGAADPTWNRANPRWQPLFHMIRSDLRRDLQPAANTEARAVADLWDRELAAHLSAPTIDELLGFYNSPTGRRYLAFQCRLTALESSMMSRMIIGLAGGGSDAQSIAPEPPPSRVLIEQREHILGESWARLTLPMLDGAASADSAAYSGSLKSFWESSIRSAVITKGPVLDALHSQYGADLARFGAFQKTSDALALLAVYRVVAKEMATQGKDSANALGMALQRSVALHSGAWKAAYTAGRSPASADQVPTRSLDARQPALAPETVPEGTIAAPGAWKKGAVARRLAVLPNAPFVNGLDFSPDGSMLAVATPTRINIWAVRDARVLHTLEDESSLNLASQAMRFSPNGLYLAACHDGRSPDGAIVRIWSTQRWSYVHGIKGPHGCESVAFTPDSRSLLVAELTVLTSSEESLVAYDTSTWQEVWGIRSGTFHVHTLAVSPGGTLAAIGGRVLNPASWNQNGAAPTFGTPPLANMSLIGIVDLRTHKLVRTIQHTVDQTFGSLDWKPHGAFLATIGSPNRDGLTFVYNADRAEIINVNTAQAVISEALKPGHSSIRYACDGKYLIESDSTGLRVGWGLRIWTADHHSLIQVLPGEFGHLTVATGGCLLATDDNGWVSIFELR